jgi:hypothetical protein
MKKILFLILILAGIAISYLLASPKHSSLPATTATSSTQNAPKSESAVVQQNLDDLKYIVKNQDPRIALAELGKRMKSDPLVFKNCHGLAHEVGHEAFKKYNDFTKAFFYQDNVCSDGYLHGVIEERFSYATNVSALVKEMGAICDGVGLESGRCFHGVGHGLMYFTANDLPKSLSFCNNYRGEAQGRCIEGTFMENFLSDGVIHPSKYLDKNNPFYPCPIQSAGLKSYCYFYAPIYYLTLNNNDYAATLNWCNTAEKAGISQCIRGVGSLTMKYNIDKPKYVEGVCAKLPRSQVSSCIDGMVSYYLTFYDHLKLAQEMCATLEKQNQSPCDDAVTRRNKLFRN